MRTLSALLVLLLPAVAVTDDAFALKDGQRVVFLGDSITYTGKFNAIPRQEV